MNLCNKHFVVEVTLEVIMFLAPTYLDYLGAAGEFILKLNQLTVGVQTESVSFHHISESPKNFTLS
ncbi:MAG TPA: hypothetical protein V6C78_11130 [Crinalium sp.]|jgi:hypothetical protein